MFGMVVQIPGDMASCGTCKFSTVVPVISCLQLLVLGKMRSGFFCMGGMLLQFQGKRVVILVLLDRTSIPSSKKKLTAMSPEMWHSKHTLPSTS